MPINVKIIHTRDFIKTTLTASVDLAASREALLAIVSLIERPGEYDILLDTREARSMLSVADHYELGEALASHPILRRSRIAHLVSPENAQDADFFKTVAANRGVEIKAFTGLDEAISWLVMGGSAQLAGE